MEAAERQLEEQSEMQEVNDQLLAELERRDQALDEAVGLIVVLEDKVDKLMQEREMVRSVDDRPYSPSEELSSSPPEVMPQRPSKNIGRMPSFLSEASESTEALRSLYMPYQSNSDATLPKLQEENSEVEMDSPRLSVLSESSFLSIYGEKQLDLNAVNEEVRQHRKSSSVEKWIDERPIPALQRISPELLRRKQFLSINDVLESPLQRLEKLKNNIDKNQTVDRSTGVKEKRQSREVLRRVFTDKASFEHQQGLPPTPDTISTSTLRHYKNSNDTLAPEHTAFLHTTSNFTPGITHNAYQSALVVRPRSAGETITSRREGHGWDTSTQEDMTETGSVNSTSSMFSDSYKQPTGLRVPEFFNFGSTNKQREPDWGRDMMFNHYEPTLPTHKRQNMIRRSSMVEHPRSDDTITTYNKRNSAVGGRGYTDIRSNTPLDTTPRPDLPNRRSSLTAVNKLKKAREASQNSTSTPATPIVQQQQPIAINVTPNTSMKARFTSRLFRRGTGGGATAEAESESPNRSTQAQQQVQDTNASQDNKPPIPPAHTNTTPGRTRSKVNHNPNQYNNHPRRESTYTGKYHEANNNIFNNTINDDTQQEDSIERARATPPPIRRSRTSAIGTGLSLNPLASSGARYSHSGRPSSAGHGVGRDLRRDRDRDREQQRSGGGFGYDGYADEDFPNGPREALVAGTGMNVSAEKLRERRRGSVDFGLSALTGVGTSGGDGGETEESNGSSGGQHIGNTPGTPGLSANGNTANVTGRKWFGGLRRG